MVDVKCASCGLVNIFDQPYPYHAGFGDQGFLYNDEGNLTLIWSAFDPAFVAIVGNWNPWVLTREQQTQFEDALLPAPSGGRWRFKNPARCKYCNAPISDPMNSSIYYVVFEGTVNTDHSPGHLQLIDVLTG